MTEPDKQETEITFLVPPGYREEARLDVYLTEHIQNATRAKVQKGIREGRVRINGHVSTKRSYTVQPGDVLVCTLLKAPPLEIRPEPIPLDIVYEDDDLLVVNKKAGMVVHPGYGNRTGTLVHALMYHVGASALEMQELDTEDLSDEDLGLSVLNLASAEGGNRVVRPGIVHRLDKDTTGLLVVAKNDIAHARLAKQFAERSIFRRYQAIVWGVPDPSSGRIESFLGRDPRDRRRMTTVDEEDGKRAITNFETIESLGFTAHLEFRLETGRTHQIRAHAREIGHPLLGDVMYGGDRILKGPQTGARKAFFSKLFSHLPRQALHAFALGFRHPLTGEEIRLEAPLPSDMTFVIRELKTHDAY